MRLLPFSAAALAALFCLPVLAQNPALAQNKATPAAGPSATAPAAPAPPVTAQPTEPSDAAPAPSAAAASQPRPDPVVAKVNGQPVHLSDVQELAQGLPDELRGMPSKMLFPLLIDQLVDREAMVIAARKQGLDKDPAIQRQIRLAESAALQNALIQREVGPSVNEDAIAARYKQQLAGKPGELEVHARHILVTSEDQANKIIAQLKTGADFVALAKQQSSDPAAQKGGDLGWFKKGDMVPEFGAAAFDLKPGQFTEKPVHTRFGWHVIQVLEVKQNPPPTYEQARPQLRQEIVQEGVQKAIEKARGQVSIERFNPDGTPVRASDTAEPPPPPNSPAPPAENR
jgi:peptidyl-prolyl cis-trans isomerase C